MKTISETIKQIKADLDTVYPDNELQSIASLVLYYVLGYSNTDIVIKSEETLQPEITKKITLAVAELKKYKPIQYVFGETDFYGLKFKVNPDVLIPRPETEELVNWIINDHIDQKNHLHIVDIGTGSGNIAITLAKHLANSSVFATDISLPAIGTAIRNAVLNKVKIQFRNADILNFNLKVNRFQTQLFDIIVSNPPYVREIERKQMAKNVLDYEPEQALFVPDKEPLCYHEAILSFAKTFLKPGGSVYLEINEAFGKEIMEILTKYNFSPKELRKDINGKDRMLKGTLNQ